MKIKLIIGFAVALLVVLFTLQNAEVVSISFLFWEFSVSHALLIFVIFSSGLLAGFLLGSLAGGFRGKGSKLR